MDAQQVETGTSPIPIILGRPFLATINAQINVKNGLMKLNFGEMIVKINIYNLLAQPDRGDDDDICDIDLIETLTYDYFKSTGIEGILHSSTSIQENSSLDSDLLDMCKSLEEEKYLDDALWYSHIEELP